MFMPSTFARLDHSQEQRRHQFRPHEITVPTTPASRAAIDEQLDTGDVAISSVGADTCSATTADLPCCFDNERRNPQGM
jgi:hypothetical protein